MQGVGKILDQFHRAKVSPGLIPNGQIADAHRVPFDVAVNVHVVALSCFEVGDELLDDGKNVGGMAVADVAVKGQPGAGEDLPRIGEKALLVVLIDEGDINGKKSQDSGEFCKTHRAGREAHFALGYDGAVLRLLRCDPGVSFRPGGRFGSKGEPHIRHIPVDHVPVSFVKEAECQGEENFFFLVDHILNALKEGSDPFLLAGEAAGKFLLQGPQLPFDLVVYAPHDAGGACHLIAVKDGHEEGFLLAVVRVKAAQRAERRQECRGIVLLQRRFRFGQDAKQPFVLRKENPQGMARGKSRCLRRLVCLRGATRAAGGSAFGRGADVPVEEGGMNVAEALHFVQRRALLDEFLLGSGDFFGGNAGEIPHEIFPHRR